MPAPRTKKKVFNSICDRCVLLWQIWLFRLAFHKMASGFVGLTLLLTYSPYLRAQGFQDTIVARIKILYSNAMYERAELEARRALSTDTTLSPEYRTELEKYLAFSLVAEGRNREAKQHFIEALKLTPDLTLDPVLVSPKIIAVFDEAKGEFKTYQNKASSSSTPPTSGVSWRVLVYPGWEQYRQGRIIKGITLAALESALITTTLLLDMRRRSAREAYLSAVEPPDIESKYASYNRLQKAEIYTAAAAIGVWFYSQLDAFLVLPPHLDRPKVVLGTRMAKVQISFHF